MQSLLQRLLLGNAGGGGGGNPTLNYNFVDGSAFPSAITFSRGTNATQFDSSGNLVYAPNNAIRNNTMVGAVAGTPGTLPTNWVTVATGLTRTIVGSGTVNGINYIDVRFSGTTTGVIDIQVKFDGNASAIAGSTGQSWASSSWVALVGGSTANITNQWLALNEYSAGPTYLRSSFPASNILSGGATLTRISGVTTLGASTTIVEPVIILRTGSSVAIDITLRIGLPQLEIGPTATAVNPTSGTAYYGPRLDYDPSTLAAQGLLIEEARTNSIRNNTMQGAVAGTPGTLPTNWGLSGLGTLTQQVVGTGTVNGITYIDLRFSGTTSTTQVGIRFEPSNGAAGTNGQTFTFSAWVARVAGSTSNIGDISANANVYDSGSVYLSSVAFTGYPVTAPTTLSRASGTGTIASASAAFIQPQIYINFASGVAIDITLRIGLPQLELGAFATSVIPTTTTALTRNADQASVNTLSPWYNTAQGTLYANYRCFATSAYPDVVNVSDGTNANRQQQFIDASNGFTTFREVVSSTQQGIASQTSIMNTELRSAGAYSSAGVVFTINGATPVTNANVTHPTGLNRLNLGASGTGLANYLNGYLRRITYYPVRLTNAALQQITT